MTNEPEPVGTRGTPEVVALLGEQLHPDLIRQLTAGPAKNAPYLPAFEAIRQANRIFGFNGWSMRVLKVEAVYNEEAKTSSGAVYRKQVVMATVEVAALGVIRQDVGINEVAGPQGYDMGWKGAVSDAMKRALRQFGSQFGNELSDKEADPWEYQPPGTSEEAPAAAQRPAQPAQQASAPAPRPKATWDQYKAAVIPLNIEAVQKLDAIDPALPLPDPGAFYRWAGALMVKHHGLAEVEVADVVQGLERQGLTFNHQDELVAAFNERLQELRDAILKDTQGTADLSPSADGLPF